MAQPSHGADRQPALSLRSQLFIVAGLILLTSIGGASLHMGSGGARAQSPEKRLSNFVTADAQNGALGIEQVQVRDFRDEITTHG